MWTTTSKGLLQRTTSADEASDYAQVSAQDHLERMINADDASDYAQARRALERFASRMKDERAYAEDGIALRSIHLDELKAQEVEDGFEKEVTMCIPEMVRRMHSDLDNERLQQLCAEVLEDLNKRHYGVIPVILSFILEHPDDPSVARFGFGLIKHGFLTYDATLDNVGQSIIIDSMLRHKHDPVVQEYAMGCIMEDKKRWSFKGDEAHVTRVFLQAMRNHPHEPNVQVAACDALCYFSREQAIIREEWPPVAILHALNNHAHCADVQMSACTLLRRLQEATVHTPVCEHPYVQAILHAMQNHSDSENVQCLALGVLDAISRDDAGVYHIIQGGGVELIIRALPLRRCFYDAILILDRLVKSSADARRRAIERDAIAILLKPLQSTEIGPFLLVHICEVVVGLLFDDIGNTVGLQIARGGGIGPVVDVMVQGRSNGRLRCHQLEGDEILAKLATFASVDGRLPLHYAAACHTAPNDDSQGVRQIAVVEHLLNVYAEAATVQDGRGRLPLHYAIEANAPLSVLEALLRAKPATGEALCRHEDDIMLNFPPALMAAVSDCHVESIFVLLRYVPTILKRESTPSISLKRKRPSQPCC